MGTGCTGIIAPQVNTAAMATEVVAAALYPPRGRRGVGPVRAQGYGTGTATELASANDQTLVVVQAEHVDAVENIDAIVRVEGVSAVFIGPYDLSASLGRPGELTHPEVEAAMTTIRTACSAAGMPVGIFAGSTERARAVAEGTTLLACGTDLQWATGAIRAMVSSLNLE
jgi:2-keto-3-deoxy-L-rhamnonate aldolase RhmA